MSSIGIAPGTRFGRALVASLLLACSVCVALTSASEPIAIVDAQATEATKALLNRLHEQSGKGILFGGQDATAYGVGWWSTEGRCDIQEVCGRWPAIYGWDLGDIHLPKNLDGVKFDSMRQWMIEADERGGINTISLHLDNPITGKNAWDAKPAVSSILPDGSHHESFLRTLDRVANFLGSLKDKDGAPIPVVLRPFHEHNQEWPWWGKKACSEEEYVQVWRMTVRHLRNGRNLHQVLYAYSPQDIVSDVEYMYGYPGDEFVDVFGLDYYQVWNPRQVRGLGRTLSLVNQLADKHGKVAALTETGIENVPIRDWWTEMLLQTLQHDQWSRRTAWVMVWRNKSRGHHYGPYPNHTSAENFRQFSKSPLIILRDTE